MVDEKIEIFEASKNEVYSVLYGWYQSNWGCKGLNNDEIDDEFSGLFDDVNKAECTCDVCKVDLLEKHMEILASRTDIKDLKKAQLKFSMSMVINSLFGFAQVDNCCASCAPDHALEALIESHYWMGVLIGSGREREDYGIGKTLKKASDARHQFNRERARDIKSWYLKNRKSFDNKDDAAFKAAHDFNISFASARKHIRGL
jgi:hypothetical protein